MSNGNLETGTGDVPTIETPAVIADLAEELEAEVEALTGEFPEPKMTEVGSLITDRLINTRTRLRLAIEPLDWLGYNGVQREVQLVIDELDDIIDGPKDTTPERTQ